jgi:hypothetical protein
MSITDTAVATSQEQLSLGDRRLYLATVAMVLGNVALPALVHGVPNGGRIFLPIFFFTLIAGWRFGLYAALLTAVLSPLANHLLTGMPGSPMLAGIIVQSATLGVLATLLAGRERRASLPRLGLVVLLQQVLVSAIGLWQSGWQPCLAALQTRIPGLAVQILGGFLVLRLLDRWLPQSGQTDRAA